VRSLGIAAILSALSPETGSGAGGARLDRLAPLRADPASAAILTDVDGTLAPIVERPDQAAVPEAAREVLITLSRRFGLVGCVSGRQAEEARRLVGVEEIAYAGNHGLELLLPGEDGPQLDPSLGNRERAAAEFIAAQTETVEGAGLRTEDKGPIQALHWRGAKDERAAEARAHELAAAAGRAGLEPRWGRKVLELRPAGGGGKDAAVAALLATDGIRAAAYAGDDRTDLDAFRRLRELREKGELEAALCVGVASPEAPPELAQESDWTVDGPAGWLAALESLVG
jgi:trehalose 6-phosphate phosphatase